VVKRRGDIAPEPPAGRAAERLRMFLDARRPKPGRKKPKGSATAARKRSATKQKEDGK